MGAVHHVLSALVLVTVYSQLKHLVLATAVGNCHTTKREVYFVFRAMPLTCA
jgi:hypothetical protein